MCGKICMSVWHLCSVPPFSQLALWDSVLGFVCHKPSKGQVLSCRYCYGTWDHAPAWSLSNLVFTQGHLWEPGGNAGPCPVAGAALACCAALDTFSPCIWQRYLTWGDIFSFFKLCGGKVPDKMKIRLQSTGFIEQSFAVSLCLSLILYSLLPNLLNQECLRKMKSELQGQRQLLKTRLKTL